MTGRTHTVKWTETAVKLAEGIKDRRERAALYKRVGELGRTLEQQGKPLIGELAGFRSIRAVGQRYRIIYRVQQKEVVVVIMAVGRRKGGDKADIYALAKKLLRQGLFR
jgi:mRNA interferase RelE/StbE